MTTGVVLKLFKISRIMTTGVVQDMNQSSRAYIACCLHDVMGPQLFFSQSFGLGMATCACGGSLRGKGRGYCATCRNPGPLPEPMPAVLGHCRVCGRKLRGNGTGYCPGASRGKCVHGISVSITTPSEEPDDAAERRRRAEKAKKEQKALRRLQCRLEREKRERRAMLLSDRDANADREYRRERMRMFDNDPLTARRRREFFCQPAVEE